MTPVGVVGLGSMGMGVAASLLRAGFAVRGYDVRAEAMQRWSELGGGAASSPAKAAAGAQALIVLVLDAAQTEQTLFGPEGAANAMPKGAVVITSSTVAPAFAAELGGRLEQCGLLHIDGPV